MVLSRCQPAWCLGMRDSPAELPCLLLKPHPASSAVSLQADLWVTPCGGTVSSVKDNTTDPSVCCPLESQCLIWNEELWRCIPDWYTGPTRGPSAVRLPGADGECAARWL
jgi:hypothetical protein